MKLKTLYRLQGKDYYEMVQRFQCRKYFVPKEIKIIQPVSFLVLAFHWPPYRISRTDHADG